MTQTQARLLAFAQLHDWGYDAQLDGNDDAVIVGADVHSAQTNTWAREFTRVTSLTELRNWAGY